MDDLDDLQASEFVTDTEDQDSLDERIDSEQRIRNQQLWASFQNAACCITKLYKDRAQPNISPWVPFQNAASNLTTLYKDCIESQRRFARLGYQVGKRRRTREIGKLLKKHKIATKNTQSQAHPVHEYHQQANVSNDHSLDESRSSGHQHNNVSSILAVNQLNLGCDEIPSHSMQAQPSSQLYNSQQSTPRQQIHLQQTIPHQQSNLQTPLNVNEEDLLTFQQALAQSTVREIKSSQNRRPCSNSSGYLNSRAIDAKTEEERLLELNQFLSEEYHRHVGSRKRSCTNTGGSNIKRFRD